MRARQVGWWVIALVALACATPGDPAGGQTSSSPGAEASVVDETPGDAAPHQAENNGWKQRHELSGAQRLEGDRLAGRIRPELTRLRAAGDVTPESVRRALLGLGLSAEDIEVTAMPAAATDPAGPAASGAVYAVRFGEVGCVVGDVRPERVRAEVTGSAAEFGCLEPVSH